MVANFASANGKKAKPQPSRARPAAYKNLPSSIKILLVR